MTLEYLTVSAITDYLRYKIVQDPYLKKVYLEGEITNFRKRNSHQYFNLKDEDASINITMFASRFKEVDFEVENGVKVVISGHIDIYPKNGTYSLIAHSMQLSGEGALHQRFEEIKARLTKEGLFDKVKKSLPKYPRKIAVVTSETGAVIHDIIRTVNQRFPMTELVLFPTLVQGPEAAESIAQQINEVNKKSDLFDLVIVGRGGGSYEDLFCFNEERVVRAAYELKIPLVTSVGHETDYTLIDQVADYSAATPTMAAERTVPDRMEELAMIHQFNSRLSNSIKQLINHYEQLLDRYSNSTVLQSPENLYKYQTLYLEQLNQKLSQFRPDILINQYIGQIKNQESKLNEILNQIDLLDKQLDVYSQKLQVLNPESVLKRGYAYVTLQEQTVESCQNLQTGDILKLHFADGNINVEVKGD